MHTGWTAIALVALPLRTSLPPSARQPANHGTHRLQSGNPVRPVSVRPVLVCAVPVRAVPVRAGSRYMSAVGGSGSGGSSSGVAVSLSAVRRFGSPTVRFGGSGSIRAHHAIVCLLYCQLNCLLDYVYLYVVLDKCHISEVKS